MSIRSLALEVIIAFSRDNFCGMMGEEVIMAWLGDKKNGFEDLYGKGRGEEGL